MKKFELCQFSNGMFKTCWNFLNDMDYGCAQAGELHLLLSDADDEPRHWITKATPFTCPCYSWPVWSEMMELRTYLLEKCWGYGEEFDLKKMQEWLFETSGTYAEFRGDIWLYNIQSDIAVYQLRLTVDERADPLYLSAHIAAFDRGYLTENPDVAALIPACHDHSVLPPQHDYAFAKAVCEHVLANTADAPAVQERLRSAIRAMDHLMGRCSK